MMTSPPAVVASPYPPVVAPARARVTSIDATRGFVMATMIFVNDLAGAPEQLVPPWLRHFGRGDGMTFVDLVFPGFLFIVGMSIPFALGPRLEKGDSPWRILFHVLTRTLALLALGILMVNESPNAKEMGWSPDLWVALMYVSAMLAFCAISPPMKREEPSRTASDKADMWRRATLVLRVIGGAGLIWLALAFRNSHGRAILQLAPFSLHHSWYGILGLIGWAYLVASVAFLFFRKNSTALLGCTVLLLCLYPAEKTGLFRDSFISVGEMLGAHPSITTAGVLLSVLVFGGAVAATRTRVRSTVLFIAGFAGAAVLVRGLYGINKNEATPAWCLWSCAITAAVWLMFYFVSDVRRIEALRKPFAIAGQNVLLAYLISEGLGAFLNLLGLGGWYDHLAEGSLFAACARSAICAVAILAATAGLNRVGFRLKL